MVTEKIFDIALSTDWEYDSDFIEHLEQQAKKRDLTTYVIWTGNLDSCYKFLQEGRMKFNFLFDRASDTSPEFYKIQSWIEEHEGQIFEPLDRLRWASDKATMHLEFVARGIITPYTIILPPYELQKPVTISKEELAAIGESFVIKPANTTGGGRGVVNNANTIEEIIVARKKFPADKYLIQKKVNPQELDGRRFWFRGFFSCGLVQLSWWNDLTHLYEEVSTEDITHYRLESLFTIVQEIARISRLNFFSTEIAIVPDYHPVVVDYVNESSDMRLKSKAYDGVPDQIVSNIACEIVRYIEEKLHP